jgi:hypothetical protein
VWVGTSDRRIEVKGGLAMRLLRRSALFAGLVTALGLVAAAPAAADPANQLVITAGCNEPGGETFFIDVAPRGSIAFVLDSDGERTGELLHLLSIDLAGFTNPGGQLVFEQHMTWGNRTGQTDVISCSGTFFPEPGIIAFFDALATRG